MPQPVFAEYEELDKAYRNPGHLMFRKMRLVTDAITPGDALLDFGCGEGELLSRVAGRFTRVAGLDVTDKALEYTRNKLSARPETELYRYTDGMPEIKGGFDWVTCLDVLEHVDNPQKTLGEIRSVMKQGGNLIVTVPNWYDFVTSKLLGLNKYHLHVHTPWGWANIIRDTGFEIAQIRAVGFPLVNSDILARRLYFLGMCIFIKAVSA